MTKEYRADTDSSSYGPQQDSRWIKGGRHWAEPTGWFALREAEQAGTTHLRWKTTVVPGPSVGEDGQCGLSAERQGLPKVMNTGRGVV